MGFRDRVQALSPSATLRSLLWDPWEAAAGERVALARVHLERGEYGEAIELASELDSHRAVVNLLYLPESLEIRALAADATGNNAAAARYRRRLDEIRNPGN